MKVAVLGGGFTGLAAAYYLTNKGHKVTLYEKEPVLGGLAVGFKARGWDWYLERAYHHLFSNDHDILNFAREIGFEGIFFKRPETDSLYTETGHNSRIIPLDSPQDLLKFPYLSFLQKIRAGMVLAFLKLSPFLRVYEKTSVQEFMSKYMGSQSYEVLFGGLMRKKFGKYAGNILMSFFWARIKKRTPSLGYVKGGFQALIDHTERKLRIMNVDLRIGEEVSEIRKKKSKFVVGGEVFDAVISTLPSPVLYKTASNILPEKYLSRFKKLKFLHAIVLILETKKKFLDKTYWLNVCSDKLDVMAIVQHTNMIDRKYYGNNNILYIANYVPFESPLIKMSDQEVLNYYLPQLKKINSKFNPDSIGTKFYVFKGPFAQPIFDHDFLKNKPDFATPVKNFYIANLDMTYPYDRGTNYAVRLGRQVADML